MTTDSPACAGVPARLSGRVLFALVIGQVCLHASMAGLRLCLPLMMLGQGGWAGWPPGAAAGVVLGLFAAAPVVLALPAGRWVDRRGYHKPVSAAVGLGVFGGLVACGAALLGPSSGGLAAVVAVPVGLTWAAALQALLLLVAATCIGTGCNVGLIAMQRIAGKLAQEAASAGAGAGVDAAGGAAPAQASAELRRVFSWLGIAPALGNVGGPLLAGVLIDSVGYTWACAALCLLPLGKAWWSRRVPPDGPPRPRPAPSSADAASASGAQARSRGGVFDLLALPGVRRLLVINWFFSSSWDLHGFVVPLLGHERGLSASAIGTVLGVFAAAVAAVRLCIPLVSRHLRERQVLGGAMVLVALVFAAYPLAHSAVQMCACAVWLGLALGSVQPMIMTALHHLAPPDRQGEAIALRSAIINLSSSVLPMAFGVVGAALGATLLFRGMAVVLMLGLPLALRLEADRGNG
jgi:MFS family permease